MNRDFLFISGCPRSGTTALAHLIGAHSKVVMSLERYSNKIVNRFDLTKDLFEPERFVSLQEGDTYYDSFDEIEDWDPNFNEKVFSEDLRYIGDKKPYYYKFTDLIFSRFDNCIMLLIYRDLYDVAASWNERVQRKKNWQKDMDYVMAVEEWNMSLDYVIDAVGKYPDRFICVKYEDIFSNYKDIEPLYDKLNLDIDKSSEEKYRSLIESSKELEKARKQFKLTEEETEYVSRHGDFEKFKIVDSYNLLNK